MNDLEMIQHWRLRDEFEIGVGLLCASVLFGLLFAALAILQAGPWLCWALFALGYLALSAGIVWRLHLIARRLRALDDLIP
jgi:hypothetical protein